MAKWLSAEGLSKLDGSLFLLFQHGVEGDLPYVTTDYSFEVQGAGKLHIYKGLARPGFIKSNN